MSELKIVGGEVTESDIRLNLSDGRDVTLSDADTVTLLGLLKHLVEEAGTRLPIDQKATTPIHHLQMRETAEKLILRVFVSDRVAHSYDVDRSTTLAEDLMHFWDASERRQAAKASPAPGRKQ